MRRHDLSGCYFREQNPETGKWENVCFEELSRPKQDEILSANTEEFARGLVYILSDALVKVGEQFHIYSGDGEEESDAS